MSLVPLSADHADALVRFFRDLPDGDRTFIKEDVADPGTVRGWAAEPAGSHRWVAVDDGGAVLGYVAVLPLAGWSDHVGEVRLVVAPAARGTGLGRELTRHALVEALEAGLTKLVVEVVPDQGPALALFTALGFTGEALLRDQIRDRNGQLRDLLVLAHHVGDTWSGMAAVGIVDALDEPAG